VLTPPGDLDVRLVADAFGLGPLTYQPVGWGSHHWSAGDLFVTVDDLRVKAGTDLDASFDRLRRSLDAASASGLACVVAPVRPLVRLDRHYAATVYPFVTGESFSWGAWPSESHRVGVLKMLSDLHRAPEEIRRRAPTDDFVLAHRDALFDPWPAPAGPFAARAEALIAAHAGPVRELLARYDRLVAAADPARAVLTHGEPHPGNTMRTAEGWKLIDWETALVAPPERDLWLLGDDLSLHSTATGIAIVPEMLTLYRLRWQLTDLCVDLHRFRRPHTGTADDVESWKLLHSNMVAVKSG